MKALRKRSVWILLAVVLLPILTSWIWYNRQLRQQHLDHALIEAIKREDTSAAIALLNQGADANTTDKPYQPMTLKRVLADFWNRGKGNKPPEDKKVYPTALLLPKRLDSPELTKALLVHGANPNAIDLNGWTALSIACIMDHPNTLKVLLEHHVNPNVKDVNGYPPLFYAVFNDPEETCLRLLIENRADVNATDEDGLTALHYAVALRMSKVVRILLQHGVKVSIKDIHRETALDFAKENHFKELIPFLEAALIKEQAEHKLLCQNH